MTTQDVTLSLQWDGSVRGVQNIVTAVNSLFPDEENPAAHNMRYVKPAIVISVGNETAELTTENTVIIKKNSHVTISTEKKESA